MTEPILAASRRTLWTVIRLHCRLRAMVAFGRRNMVTIFSFTCTKICLRLPGIAKGTSTKIVEEIFEMIHWGSEIIDTVYTGQDVNKDFARVGDAGVSIICGTAGRCQGTRPMRSLLKSAMQAWAG